MEDRYHRLLPLSVLPLLMAVVTVLSMSGGRLWEMLRPLPVLVLVVGYVVWRARRMARDPDYACRQVAKGRAQSAALVFFFIVLGGVALLAFAASRDHELEQTLMPYMEAAPLLVFVLGAPLFVWWRTR